MSGNDIEIPGFYRDPVTGKYYKDVPGSTVNPALKKLQIYRKEYTDFTSKPKIINVTQFLNARELKNIGGVQESNEFLRMRWYMKKQIKSTALDKLRVNFNFKTVNYVIGSNDSIYGFWNDKKNSNYVIGAMKLNDPSDHHLYFHKAFGFIIDMCEGLFNDFVVLYNSFCRNGILVECIDEYDRMPLLQYGQRFAYGPFESFKMSVYCCSCSKKSSRIAFGCKNCIGFVNGHNREDYVKVNGRVHTIAFDDTGNLLTTGVHTGRLFLHDLRTSEMVMNMEVSKSCLIDSSMLNSHQIIVAGAEDVLCSVDLRKKEVLTEFLTHKEKGIRRQPFSIANNMLCALGSDNVIRIWDLAGGLPIHQITALEDPQNQIKGWLCNIDNKTCLYHFEGATRKIFQIL